MKLSHYDSLCSQQICNCFEKRAWVGTLLLEVQLPYADRGALGPRVAVLAHKSVNGNISGVGVEEGVAQGCAARYTL